MKDREFKTIIFDLDGTLIDSAPGVLNSVQYALKKMGIENVERESLYPFIGPPLKDSFMEYFAMTEDDAMKSVDFYREYYSKTGVYEVTLYGGIREVLIALKNSGKQIMMGTSKPEVFAKEIAEYLNIDCYFDLIAGANLEGTRDRKKDVLIYGLQQLDIFDSSEVLMVGDRKFDVLGAEALNIDTLGVLYGYGTREELEEAGAKWIVEKPVDIVGVLSV